MALSNVFPMMMLKDNDEIVRTSGIVTSSLTLMLFLSAIRIFVSNLSYTIDNTAIAQIEIGGVETAASLLITGLHLPGSTAVTVGSFLVSVVLATSPSKVVINQSLYEVHFAYDNSYYTHCYHDILYSYDSGGHLMDTTKSYHQAVGG